MQRKNSEAGFTHVDDGSSEALALVHARMVATLAEMREQVDALPRIANLEAQVASLRSTLMRERAAHIDEMQRKDAVIASLTVEHG